MFRFASFTPLTRPLSTTPKYGIKDALLVDNTGRWRGVPGLEQHLNRPGISRVLLTAPGKGDMKNIVFGVNDNVITDEDRSSPRSILHHQRDYSGTEGSG